MLPHECFRCRVEHLFSPNHLFLVGFGFPTGSYTHEGLGAATFSNRAKKAALPAEGQNHPSASMQDWSQLLGPEGLSEEWKGPRGSGLQGGEERRSRLMWRSAVCRDCGGVKALIPFELIRHTSSTLFCAAWEGKHKVTYNQHGHFLSFL